MKIVSKFQDYYDSYQFRYGEDVYYERNMNLREFVKEKRSNFMICKESNLVIECNEIFHKFMKTNFYTIENQVSFDICFIGEKIVPFITVFDTKYSYSAKKFDFFFNYEDLFNYLEIMKKKDNFLENFYIKNTLKKAEEHFNRNFIDLYNNIRSICKEPIISYSAYRNNSDINEIIKMNSKTMLNPCLKELGFSKAIDPFIVIQELELFIKKLSNVEKEVEMSNEIKILNAGFDKHSFKH